MSLLNLGIRKWILPNAKLIFMACLAVLISLSLKAQIPSGQLPVNLKIFKARAETNKKVKVFWTTLYEKDNAYFDIERSSDGVHYTVVGKIPGVNNYGIPTDYYFYDDNALKGISFYRLKQVDINTVFTHSPVERVKISETATSFDIYPNPVPGHTFKIDLLKYIPGNIDVTIFDQSGRVVLQQQFSNNNIVTIYHQLKAGSYNIKITCKELVETRKMIIQ